MQSLEVAKYVWFILKEMGVPDIPPLAKIRSIKFGQLDVENLISKVYFVAYVNYNFSLIKIRLWIQFKAKKSTQTVTELIEL